MGKRRFLVISVAALVALVGTFLGLLLRSSGDATAPRLQGQHLKLVASARRKPLPHLAGPALNPPPPTLRLRVLAGKPAFIDVWASWCVPCREEAPLLAHLWRQYRSQVRFLGIDVEDSRGAARAFTGRYGIGYPHIFDAKARLASKLGFFGLPTAYFVDANGRVAAKLIGKQKEATLRAAFAALAQEAKTQ